MTEDRSPPEPADEPSKDDPADEDRPQYGPVSERLERLFELLRQPVPTDSLALQFIAEHPQFGRYQFIRPLGEGAMGLVFLVRDTTLDREVALKLPKLDSSDSGRLARFEREAKAAAGLRHPNICTVYDFGEIQGHHFITMAFIDGRPLSDVISACRSQLPAQDASPPIGRADAARLVRKLADALDEAHRNGLVHRDLKPSNIMIDNRGEPIITDFGLARHVAVSQESRVTASGSLVGTPAYMSPEQVRGEVDRVTASSDIYSLGVVLYELLTGTVPFCGSFGDVVAKILTVPPTCPSELHADVPPALEAICMKMLQKRQESRFPCMAAVSEALHSFLATTAAETGLPRGDLQTPDLPPPPPSPTVRDIGDTFGSETVLEDTMEDRHATASPRRTMVLIALRWIACAPAAVLAAVLAHFVVLLLNTWSMEFTFMNPNSFFGRLLNYAISSAVLGVVAVRVAVSVAPAHKRGVAWVSAGLVLFLSGLAAYPLLSTSDLWGLFALLCTNVGSIGTAYTTHSPALLEHSVRDYD
jgi:serine/threonine protein kinase